MKRWDEPLACSFTKMEFEGLKNWSKISIENKPVAVTCGRRATQSGNPVFLVVDASGYGWGAALYNENKLFSTFTAGKWWGGGENGVYGSSVKAEPEGLVKAVKHLERYSKKRMLKYIKIMKI